LLLFYVEQFLGAFAKLRKRLLPSSCLSVRPSFRISVRSSVRLYACPSVRMEQLGSYGADFHEICNLTIFRKFFEKIKFLLKSGDNNEDLT
jgi:hypothetical protein